MGITQVRTRAYRRASRERYRKRNRQNYPGWSRAWMFGDTRCKCGKPCCNKAREIYGPTFVERRALARCEEGIPLEHDACT